LCSGSTEDFGSFSPGSNPGPAANHVRVKVNGPGPVDNRSCNYKCSERVSPFASSRPIT
jgi:hypothetical protein